MEAEFLKKVRSYQDNLKLPTNSDYLNYLTQQRGLSIETIEQFQLGIDDQGNITIPVHNPESRLLGFKYRSNPLKEVKKNKYWHDEGLGNEVFNLNRIPIDAMQVILCEGEFDAMILSQYGFHAVSQTTGADVSRKIIGMIQAARSPKSIIVGLDNDSVGRKSMFKLAKVFMLAEPQVSFCEVPEFKDWNEMTVALKTEGANANEITEQLNLFIEITWSAAEYVTRNYREFDSDYLQTVKVSEIEDVEIEFLAKPLVVKNGINLVTAAPKSLKSMLVIHLLIACMSNQKFAGFFETKPIQKALLIDQESLKPEVRNRVLKLSGDPDKFLITKEYVYFDQDPELTQKILATVQYEGIDVVVVDTLRRVNLDMDENSSKDVAQFFAAIRPISEKSTVIIIHHDTKGTMGNKSTYRGSGDILGAVDSHIYVQATSKSDKNAVIKIMHKNSRYSGNHQDVEVEFSADDNQFKFSFLGKTAENIAEELQRQHEESLLGLETFIAEGEHNGRSTPEIESFCKESFSVGAHKSRRLREELVNEGILVKVPNFNGSHATHFIYHEFAAQQLNSI